MAAEKQGKAIDLSHHLSDLGRNRKVSPLKGLTKYLGHPNLIMLAGGMPHPNYFPFADISANALAPESFSLEPKRENSPFSWVWKLFGAGSSKERTIPINIPKFPSKPDDVSLAVSLQYGSAQGIIQLQKIVTQFSEKVFQPAFGDFATLVHTGNTDAWTRTLYTLCNPGEMFLAEEWSYPSIFAASLPYNVKPVSVAMDGEGMRADDLRKILSEWDEQARGAKRPHVMYTIPIGQNPSGATMGYERKKDIYDICVEYDIIIVEDDPYYFLQEGKYLPKSERSIATTQHDSTRFLASLSPSYLKLDYQGRVIRFDTFSKSIAPGSRLGWFTCNPMFVERLERHGETSSQAPSGFSQSLITQLLTTWGHEGFIRWLHGLTVQYTDRRDYMIDCILDEFHVQRSNTSSVNVWEGCEVFEVYPKRVPSGEMSEKFSSAKKMFSFVPPTSGMFLWIKLHFESLPSYKPGDEDSLEMKLWTNLAEEGVLISPGWFFSSQDTVDTTAGHFRISFSNADPATMKRGMMILSKIIKEFFEN